MCRDLRLAVIWGLAVVLISLAGCGTPLESISTPDALLAMSTPTALTCEACAQATLAAAQTQERNNADFQAAATAEIMRANAQATVNSANATLSAAQTQEQNNANVIAAQIAATAAIVRANAQATLDSAGATQNAALTQDAIRQTQMSDLVTTGAQATANQQNQDELAASTQTAIANTIATQTQSAAATSQWYVDQERQREEQRQGPIAFLWMWCLPIFLILLAGLVLWGFWRWLKIRQASLLILEQPVEKLQAPADGFAHHHHHTPPYLESDVVDGSYQVTKPDDEVRHWLDEVKDQLQSSDEKDKAEDDAND